MSMKGGGEGMDIHLFVNLFETIDSQRFSVINPEEFINGIKREKEF